MTQSNPPNEIKCPHCGQNYAIQPEQWPQYQGQTIACTKCSQPFVVGASPQRAPGAPPPLPPIAQPPYPMAGGYPPQGYGYPPPKKGMSGGAVAAIVLGILAVVAIPCLIAILLPSLNKVREEALKAKCSSNLKNIAAAMITYSNTNNGQYPDSMETLMRTSGASPNIFVCPDSNDTPLTKSLTSVTTADLNGHCSYVYAAAGLNSNAGPNEVLVFDSFSDHHGRGVNILYGDYHVAWVTAAQAKTMIQLLPPTPTTLPSTSAGNGQ